MRDASLRVEPLIRLLRKLRDAPLFEKFRRDALCRCLVGDMLGAFFAEFKVRTLAVRLGPGAAGTINAVFLVQLQKRPRATPDAHLGERILRCDERRRHPTGDFSYRSYDRRR